MEPITSVRNPRIREAASLARRRERTRTGRHLVEGPNAVREALAVGVVEVLFGTDEALAAVDVPDGVEVQPVSDHVLERLADAATPQGVVGVAVSQVASLSEVVGTGLLVVLHEVADPGNAGTIVRTADAAGVAGVVLTRGSVDPFGPKAVRAAVGSTYHLPLVVDAELAEVVDACRSAGQPLLGLDAAASRSVFELSTATPPLGLVLGNEAHGLPGDAADLLDGVVSIPQWGRAESLNVAAAAAVAVYAAAQAVHGTPHPSHPAVG